MANYNLPMTSRYYGIPTVTIAEPDGRVVAYLQRRFVPPPERFAVLLLHQVTEGERLDNIAGQYLNDAEAFWRIADANRAMRPDELTEAPGRSLRIALPEGIPGVPNA
jgi:hypothetical protein